MKRGKVTLANQKLETFLKKECVWEKFIKNTLDNYGEYPVFAFEIEDLILAACFVFDETHEGHDFWQKLHNKFNEQLYLKNKKL